MVPDKGPLNVCVCAACCEGSDAVRLDNRCGRHDGTFAGGVTRLSPSDQCSCVVVRDAGRVRALRAAGGGGARPLRCRSPVAARGVVVAPRGGHGVAAWGPRVAAEPGRRIAPLVCALAVAAIAFAWRAVTGPRHCSAAAVPAVQHGKFALFLSPGMDSCIVRIDLICFLGQMLYVAREPGFSF